MIYKSLGISAQDDISSPVVKNISQMNGNQAKTRTNDITRSPSHGSWVPLTNCSKDGHKKASSPQGLYSLMPSLFEVHSTSLIILIFWKEQNLVQSGSIIIAQCHDCGLSPIKWIFPTAAALFLLSGVWKNCHHSGCCWWLIQFSTP